MEGFQQEREGNHSQTHLAFGRMNKLDKDHSFCKQCLHDLQFKKTRYSSSNFSKLARADISCQFKKTS